MTTTNHLTPGLAIFSLLVSIAICTLYYLFRPTPISISEITSSTPTSISDTTTLRGIVSRNSAPDEPGDYYLVTSDHRMIQLITDQDLIDYLGLSVSIRGTLTLQSGDTPPQLTIDLINISN